MSFPQNSSIHSHYIHIYYMHSFTRWWKKRIEQIYEILINIKPNKTTVCNERAQHIPEQNLPCANASNGI